MVMKKAKKDNCDWQCKMCNKTYKTIHLLDEINERLSEKELHLELTDEAKKLIIERAYDPQLGARPLKRYLQKTVETMTAHGLLAIPMQSSGSIPTMSILHPRT